MLTVCFTVPGDNEDRFIKVYQGAHVDHLATHPGLKYIQADGPELGLIRAQFSNLPATMPVITGVYYYGDTARFILGNIQL